MALIAERLVELWVSARHATVLRARGAVEHGHEHFPLFVILHAAFLVALPVEVLWLGAQPPVWWPACAVVAVFAEGLRWWAIRSLAERWNVRIWVLPGAPLVTRGPYRYLRHPNYVAVVLELLAVPLAFGAWRTALGASLANGALLLVRIRVEERALGLRAAR